MAEKEFKNRFDFRGDPDSFVDPGSFFRTLHHCEIGVDISRSVLPPVECVRINGRNRAHTSQ